MSDKNFNQELDCKGMNCPMPVIKTKKAIDALESGEVLKLLTTDPGSSKDMEGWAKQTGNTILSAEENSGEFVFYIEKK